MMRFQRNTFQHIRSGCNGTSKAFRWTIFFIVIFCFRLPCIAEPNSTEHLVIKNFFFRAEIPNLQFEPVLYFTFEKTELAVANNPADQNMIRFLALGGIRRTSTSNNITFHGIQIFSQQTWQQCNPKSNGNELDFDLTTFALHTSLSLPKQILLFGGLRPDKNGDTNKFVNINGVYELIVESLQGNLGYNCSLKKLQTINTPPPRHAHTMVQLNDEEVITHGGCAEYLIPETVASSLPFFDCKEMLNDVHIYHITEKTWRPLKMLESPKISYHNIGLLLKKKIIYLLGGHTMSGTQSKKNNATYVIELPKKLRNATEFTVKKAESIPVLDVPNRGVVNFRSEDTVIYLARPRVTTPFHDGMKVCETHVFLSPVNVRTVMLWFPPPRLIASLEKFKFVKTSDYTSSP